MDMIRVYDFYSKFLENSRKIRVALPASYYEEDRRYPVLYVHDGQNVFTPEESFSGNSWDLHITAKELMSSGKIQDIIIVAIDNAKEDRLSEYAYADGTYLGEKVNAKGDKYASFLIEELKPYIDTNFRTLSDFENTAIMGSSMGGLVSLHIGISNPGIFGKIAAMSPSFWWGDAFTLDVLDALDPKDLPMLMWVDMGDNEGFMMEYCDKAVSIICERADDNMTDIVFYRSPRARHSERDWGKRVHSPLLYFFGDIGKMIDLEVYAPKKMKVGGDPLKINPVARFDSGFSFTPLDVMIYVQNEGVISIEGFDIYPKSSGRTKVSVEYEGLRRKKYIVVK